MIKHNGHLKTREKCQKHEPQGSVFYISLMFTNAVMLFHNKWSKKWYDSSTGPLNTVFGPWIPISKVQILGCCLGLGILKFWIVHSITDCYIKSCTYQYLNSTVLWPQTLSWRIAQMNAISRLCHNIIAQNRINFLPFVMITAMKTLWDLSI